jgi:hypothetical protein
LIGDPATITTKHPMHQPQYEAAHEAKVGPTKVELSPKPVNTKKPRKPRKKA